MVFFEPTPQDDKGYYFETPPDKVPNSNFPITSVTNTADIALTVVNGNLSGLFVSHNISQFTNDSLYLQTVAVDGITITGDGTPGNPLVAVIAPAFITSIDNTGNDVTLAVSLGVLTANLTSTLISQFTNDSGYITSWGPETDPVFTAWLAVPPNISVFTNDSGYLTAATAGLLYQPLDADLTSIAALGFASTSFLKKTALNTWALDTNTYMVSGTGVTSVSGTASRISSTGGTTPVIDIDAAYAGQTSITTLGTIVTGVWNGTAIANANLANSTITIGSTAIALGASSTTLAGLTSVTSTTFVGALTGTASGNYVVGGALGTPSSGTGTNLTGIPLTTGLTGGNWKVIYTNGTGVITELALGAANTFLKSTGASSAPVFDTPAATVADADYGDVTVSSSGTVWTVDSFATVNEAADTTCNIIFVTSAASASSQPKTNASLTFDSSTVTLGSTIFSGTAFKTSSANPALTGVYRMANTQAIRWRNFLNSTQYGISLNTSDIIVIDRGITTGGDNSMGGNTYPTTDDGASLGVTGTNRWSDIYLASGAIIDFNSNDANITHSAAKLSFGIGGAAEVEITAGALSPSTSDGNALGTTSLMWSDLFVASGGVINHNAGSSTITGGANIWTFGGSGANGNGIVLPAGGTSLSPLQYISGTNLTVAAAGATEYDATQFYQTIDTTTGRGAVSVEQYFRYAGNGSNLGAAIADFFGANSAIPMAASGIYEITFYAYYLKNTAGTVTWTITFSGAVTNWIGSYHQSAVTGISTEVAELSAGLVTQTGTAAFPLSATNRTTAANHRAIIHVLIDVGATPRDVRLRVTSSAGTVTPLRGSYYLARRLPASSTGTFAA